MSKYVQKTFGSFPDKTVVLNTLVMFDAEGYAEVDNEDVLDVFRQVPGYVVYEDKLTEDPPSTEDDPPIVTSEDDIPEDGEEENTSEDEQEAQKPKPPAKKKPSPRTKTKE